MIKVEAQSSPAMTSHTPKWNGSAQLQWSGRVGSARYRCTSPPLNRVAAGRYGPGMGELAWRACGQ